MAIERNPVPGTRMKHAMRCVDFDASGKRLAPKGEGRCEKALHSSGGTFVCPNKGNGDKQCQMGGFLYPRFVRSDGTVHYHQGIDLTPKYPPGSNTMRTAEDERDDPDGAARPRSQILTVVSGKVKHADQSWNGKKGYGIRVVIEGDDGLFYIHAHCYKALVRKDDHVVEQQPIAIVGRTGIATGWIPDHLHFEISSKHQHTARAVDETKLGGPPLFRHDPLEMLAKLGPWGESDTFLPLTGKKTTAALVETYHHAVERLGTGGYFPLGANNFWHGGVHLSMPVGHLVHAPFGGTVVAARLGSDPDQVNGAYGSTNFILLRHEIGVSAFGELQRKPGAPPPPPSTDPKPSGKKPAVGQGKSNPPATVKQVKRRLFELGHYPPGEDEEPRVQSTGIDAVDVAAIKSFQIAVGPKKKSWESWWPDGVIDVPGYTWGELFPSGPPKEPGEPEEPEAPPPESLDPKRTVYSLFMHLQPLDADEALAQGVTWLPPEVDDDQAEASAHTNTTDVGAGMGDEADVAWVKKRLIRFGFFTEGGSDDEFDAAIRSFQDQHPFKKKSKKKWVDGIVGHAGGSNATIGFLRKTDAELRGEAPVTGVDRALVDKLDALGPDGVPSILLDEDLRAFFPAGLEVAGGDPLWTSGTAAGFEGDGGAGTKEEIHWEMFSEHLLFADWNPAIDDNGDDLTADIRAQLLDEIEDSDLAEDANGRIEPGELKNFYRSEGAQALRRTPCKFRSEWAMDVTKVEERIYELGFAAPPGLIEGSVGPYLWWDAAQDVLPKTESGDTIRHVWHYNPIEFLADYQEAFEAIKGASTYTPKPATDYGNLQVRVTGANGLPPKKENKSKRVQVTLYEGEVDDPATATALGGPEPVNKDGHVNFYDLTPGTYTVMVNHKMMILPTQDVVEVRAAAEQAVTVLEVSAAILEADPGTLTIYIRHESGGPASAAAVTVEGPGFPVSEHRKAWGASAAVVLRKLTPGTYRVRAKHPANGKGHPNDQVEAEASIEFDGISLKTSLILSPRLCSLTVLHADSDASTFAVIQHRKTGFSTPMVRDEATGEWNITVPRLKKPYVLVFDGEEKLVQAATKERRFRFK